MSKYIDESNEPLFAFGAGKTYGKVEANWQEIQDQEDKLQFIYEAVNHSATPIETVIHIYVKDKTASIVQPVKRLIASQVISIHADEKKLINYTVSKEALMFYNNQGEKIWESGEFTFSLSTVDSEDDRTIQL